MRENPYRHDKDDIKELLASYQNMRLGKSHSYLEEDAFERIIDYFDDAEELAQAMEAAVIAIGQFPFSALLLFKKADLLIATRRYHEALRTLDQAAVLDSRDINLYILQTDAYLALDQQEKAVELLESALSLFEGAEKIELLFELADVYDDYEEFDKIFDCLRLILEQDPTNEEALYKICFWSDFTRRNEESIELHQKILDETPYNELAWFNLAAAFQGLKLYEKSIDAYKYAVVIDEKFDYAYRNMGDAYIRLRKYRDAIEVLEKVIELSRPEDVIFEAIGHCYDKLKNFAQARFYYRKASHLSPDDSKLYYKVACTYIHEQQWNQAVKQLESAMQIHRNQPEYNLAMGECKMQLGNVKEAIQFLTNVVRSRPKNVAGWEALIKCLYNVKYYDEAMEQVHAAMRHTDNKPVFLFYQSAVLFAAGKSKEGLLFLGKAMTKAPRLIRKFLSLNPCLLQNQQVMDLIAGYKRNRNI